MFLWMYMGAGDSKQTRDLTIKEEEELIEHIRHKKSIIHFVQVCWKIRKLYTNVSEHQIRKYAYMVSPPAGQWLSFIFKDMSSSLVRKARERDTYKFRELGLNHWFNIFYYATVAFPPAVLTILRNKSFSFEEKIKLMAIFEYAQECTGKPIDFNFEDFICKQIPVAPRVSLLHLVSSVPDISPIALREFIYTHQPDFSITINSKSKSVMDNIGGLTAIDILQFCGNELAAAECLKYQ